MGCFFTKTATINGFESFPVIKNTERKTGRLDPKLEDREGFLDNMISEANADRKMVKAGKVTRVLVIYNPFSGNGLGKVNSAKLEKLLKDQGLEVTTIVSKSPGHITRIGKFREFYKYDCVAVCGGDGTINEFLQGVIERRLNIPIALCPGGTGNTLALSLGITTPKDCLDCILSNSHIGVDCNRILDANGKTFYSINMIGGALAYDANVRAEKMRCCGPMRYDCSALGFFCQGYCIPLKIDLDGKTLSLDALCFFLMNNTTMGSAAHCTPFASITDGYFDIWIVPKSSLPLELKVLGAVKDGSHIYMPEAKNTLYRAKKMKCYSDGGINIDGENCAQGPCSVECLPSSWRLMVKEKTNLTAVEKGDDNAQSVSVKAI